MQVNGWELFAHPLLLDQIEKLITTVEKERAKKPKTYPGGANFKVLAALRQLMFDSVPADPTRPEYRQGGTLGADRKHWLRAKFGGQRFRLFFRYDSRSRVIIYAWVNDSETLRTYGAKNDAYAVSGRCSTGAIHPMIGTLSGKRPETLRFRVGSRRRSPRPNRMREARTRSLSASRLRARFRRGPQDENPPAQQQTHGRRLDRFQVTALALMGTPAGHPRGFAGDAGREAVVIASASVG